MWAQSYTAVSIDNVIVFIDIRYELELEVRDGGSPTRIGLARLVVRVVDINDNSPRFDRSFYSVTIGEGYLF